MNKRRESDYLKLRRDYEEAVMQSDANLGSLKKKHTEMQQEMSEQVESLSRVRTKIEKERNQLRVEVEDLTSQLDDMSKAKVNTFLQIIFALMLYV